MFVQGYGLAIAGITIEKKIRMTFNETVKGGYFPSRLDPLAED